MTPFERGTVVVITHNRRAQLMQTLRALGRSAPGWPVIVVDNGSSDGTSRAVSREFPAIMLIRSRRNIGAAARNIAVAYVHTPYVAFCDDTTVWEPGALQHAVAVLEEHPGIGVISPRVMQGDPPQLDPVCAVMALSPLEKGSLPGPQVLSFLAHACVMRTRAFYDVGGYWPPLFVGGEEALMALDMAEQGWSMVYLENVVVRRRLARARNPRSIERRRLRNAVWVAWMRLPTGMAWRETMQQLRTAAQRRQLKAVLAITMPGMMRVLKARHVVTARVSEMHARFVARATAGGATVAQQAARSSMA